MEKKKLVKQPSRTLKVVISGNDYEIRFPTNGQLIDIETLKIQLTSDNQKHLVNGITTQADRAFITTEMIATFTILIPQLIADLRLRSLTELSLADSKPLLSVYMKEFHPWYTQWFQWINQDEEDDKELVELERRVEVDKAEQKSNRKDEDVSYASESA